MELEENQLIDRVVMGPPKTIGNITFIPILSVTFGCFKSFGAGFGGSISPIAFVTIGKDGDMSFYKIVAGKAPDDIINDVRRNRDES